MFRRSNFSVDEIPDQKGKTIIVTGGNNGLGAASVRELAKKNAHVYMGARTASKAETAIAEIKKDLPEATITFLEMDLADLESVKATANSFKASNDRLDVLLNNGGVMALPAGKTKDGYEIQFGTNYMGHALLTKLLMPILERTATEKGDARIVNVSSWGHNTPPKGGLVLAEATTDMASWNTFARYGQSKLANVLFTRELARRHPNITSTSLHPGEIYTGLSTSFENAHPWLSWLLRPIFVWTSKTHQQGALTSLFAATSPKAKSGQFYMPTAVEAPGSALSGDEKLAGELWQWTEREFERLGY